MNLGIIIFRKVQTERINISMTIEEDTRELLQQYKFYLESKDKFTDRNFSTNKFYLIFNTLLFLGIFYIDKVLAYGITSTIILAGIGLGTSFLWWFNVDTYEVLISIKLGNVIKKMEASLPFQAHLLEKEELDILNREKGQFIISLMTYSRVLKVVIVAMFIVFMVIFISDLVSIISKHLLDLYT